MLYSRATEVALVEWANTFPLDSRVNNVADLTDGVVFAKMLEDIDRTYAVRDLEKNATTSKWLGKKKSLEAVHRSLLRYIRDHCEDMDYFTVQNPVDLNIIAEHDDGDETIKLLSMFLMAAVKGTSTQKYVGKITTTLDSASQGEIAGIIQKLNAVEKVQTSKTEKSLHATVTQDLDLAFEEEHATLVSEHETLKKKHADFISRFERLQQHHDDLLEHSNKADDKLKAYENPEDGDQADYIRGLTSRIQEQEDLIASQENQVESDRVARERLSKELVTLRPSAQRLVEVEDQVKELQTANAALSRKANTVEHYQKKVEQLNNVEKENAYLRQRVDTLEGNQKDYDRVFEENARVKQTIGEYQQRFNSYELNFVELSTQKRHIEEKLRLKDDQVEVLTARQQHDEKFIDQLQEQMKISYTAEPQSPGSPSAKPSGTNLGDELERSEDPTPNLMLEISRLKAENQLLKSNTAGATTAIDVEEAERVRKRLQENLRDITEKYTLGQEQLSAMISESENEKNEAILHTRKLYLEANQELSSAKSKLAELQGELSSRDRDLVSVKTDLAAVDQEDIDAVKSLKAAEELISTSLKNDFLLLQDKHTALSTDFDEQKNHLVEALLSKDRLMQDLAASKDKSGDDPDGQARAQAMIDEEKAQREQIQKQDALIDDLQRKLKEAEESGPDAQKAANESIIKNLTRENTLIATAWYDLSSRLQSNHVVLQRRQDAPKSWLNKQRQAVQAVPRR